jgi:DNA-binding PadR family transcriptional regulator
MTEQEYQQQITENSVLGMLGLRKMSGYEIKRWILDTITRFWEIKEQEVYPVIEALVARGLVAVSPPNRGAPAPRMQAGACTTDAPPAGAAQTSDWAGQMYSVTPAGYEAIEKWLSEPLVVPPPRNEFLLKVIFARRGNPEDIIRHVEGFHQYQEEALKLNTMAAAFLNGRFIQSTPDLPYWMLANKYGKHLYSAMKEWSESALTTLRGIGPE